MAVDFLATFNDAQATLGKTSIGGTPNALAADLKRAVAFTPTADMDVDVLWVYIDGSGGGAGTQQLRGLIYADSGGSPAAKLIGGYGSITVAAAQAAGWVALPLQGPLHLTAGVTYWLTIQSGATSNVIRYYWDSVAGARKGNSDPFASGGIDPFGSITTTDDRQFSIYAEGSYAPFTALQSGDDSGLTNTARFRRVANPSGTGKVAEVIVQDGDQFLSTTGERCLAIWTGSNEQNGQEHWYAWSVFWPLTWPTPSNFAIPLEWHDDTQAVGPPPISFDAPNPAFSDGGVNIAINTGALDGSGNGTYKVTHRITSTLNLGVWHNYLIHAKWRTANTGVFEVWHRLATNPWSPNPLLALTNIPTLQSGQSSSSRGDLLLGLYRSAADTATATIYHGGLARSNASLQEAATALGFGNVGSLAGALRSRDIAWQGQGGIDTGVLIGGRR